MILFLVLFFPALLGLTILFYEIKNRFSKDIQKVNLIPGPTPIPILGNIQDIMVEPADLFKVLRKWANDYYPVYKFSSTSMFHVVNFCAPEDLQTILSNPAHNKKSIIYELLHEWLGLGLLTSHGDKWQQRRKLLTPTFHFNVLKRYISIFNKHAAQSVDDLMNDPYKEIDVLHHVSKSSLHTITETAMGFKLTNSDAEKKYRSSVYRMGEIMMYRITHPWLYFKILNYFTWVFYEERFLLKYLKNFTKNIIKEREKVFRENDIAKAQAGEDDDDDTSLGKKRKQFAMLDLLLSAKKRGQITDEGILEEVDTFMFEGHDTVSMCLQYTLMLLANHSDVQQELYAEVTSILVENREPTYEDLQAMTYMEMVIKESLRLYPSVPTIARICGEEFTASSGHTIPAGTLITLHFYDTHRLEHLYPEPEKFIPERFNAENSKDRHPYAYIAFSAGSRNCIGKKYAMLNMKCMLAAIVKNFVMLPVTKPEDIALVSDIVLRTKYQGKIKIQFKVRK